MVAAEAAAAGAIPVVARHSGLGEIAAGMEREYPAGAEGLAGFEPDNAAAYYHVACVHARLNQVDDAIDWLKKAVDKGYDKWELIKTDNDLENIRGSEYYKVLVKNH